MMPTPPPHPPAEGLGWVEASEYALEGEVQRALADLALQILSEDDVTLRVAAARDWPVIVSKVRAAYQVKFDEVRAAHAQRTGGLQ